MCWSEFDFNKLSTRCLAADQFIVCVTEKRNIVFLAIISNSVLKLSLVDLKFFVTYEKQLSQFFKPPAASRWTTVLGKAVARTFGQKIVTRQKTLENAKGTKKRILKGIYDAQIAARTPDHNKK